MNDHTPIPGVPGRFGTLAVLHPGVENVPATRTASAPAAAGTNAPSLAPRLATLQGKRLALFSNGKVNAGEIISAVGRLLEARHGLAEVRFWRKRHAGETGAAVVPVVMAWKPDLVLTALGD